MEDAITKLYKSPKQVLTTKDLALIWNERNSNNLKAKISYYVKRGSLVRLSRGVFAKDQDYDPRELATNIYAPSYISFETALSEAGFIFQYYESIFLAGPFSKTRKIEGKDFIFRKLKDVLLYNPKGIVNKGTYSIAGPERAFLDMIYLFPDYFFDNLNGLDWEECRELVREYNNKSLIKRLERYYRDYHK
ncbi:MAG: hypothetical protein PHW75_01635 [Patescibacteria group bacterium]|nr:hypothetical protein [Patescibacteria group bacterium]